MIWKIPADAAKIILGVQETSIKGSLMSIRLAMDEIHINLYAWNVYSLIKKYGQMLNQTRKAKMIDEHMSQLIDIIIWISMDGQINVSGVI
jgi:hypothetical protein